MAELQVDEGKRKGDGGRVEEEKKVEEGLRADEEEELQVDDG